MLLVQEAAPVLHSQPRSDLAGLLAWQGIPEPGNLVCRSCVGSLESAPLSNQGNCKAQVWGLKLSLFLYLSPGLFILWDLLWVVFLPSPRIPRPATLGTAPVEGAGLVSPQSSQSQGPVCQKFLLLVCHREKEEQICVYMEEMLFSSQPRGGISAHM